MPSSASTFLLQPGVAWQAGILEGLGCTAMLVPVLAPPLCEAFCGQCAAAKDLMITISRAGRMKVHAEVRDRVADLLRQACQGLAKEVAAAVAAEGAEKPPTSKARARKARRRKLEKERRARAGEAAAD